MNYVRVTTKVSTMDDGMAAAIRYQCTKQQTTQARKNMSEERRRKHNPCSEEDDSHSDSSREEARRKRKKDKEKKKKKKKWRKEERREKYRSHSSEDDSDYSRRRRKKKRKKEKKKVSGSDEGTASNPDKFAAQDVSVMEAKPLPKTEHVSEPADPIEQRKEQVERQAKLQRMVPMSREQYESQQSQIREVYDPQSGRYRTVRGTGEIIERIVSRADHAAINKQATQGDGSSFARSVYQAAKR
jgi:hypothetical protein